MKLSFVHATTILIVFVIVIMACDTQQPTPVPPTTIATATSSATATVTSSPTATAVAVDAIVPTLTEANSIQISDGWGGYSSLGVVVASYDLERKADMFSGQATFFAREESLGPREVMTDVTIPTNIVERSITMLTESPAREGTYDCMSIAGCCDHYPSLSIEVQVGENKAKFYSCSKQTNGSRWASILHGGDRVPWALDFKGKTYVINSARPAEGYSILDPYLKKDVLANLIREVGENPDSGIVTPTAEPQK